MFDLNHPFFEPLWIRVLTTGILLGWGTFEFLTAAPFWGVLFCGAGLAAGYKFFVASKE